MSALAVLHCGGFERGRPHQTHNRFTLYLKKPKFFFSTATQTAPLQSYLQKIQMLVKILLGGGDKLFEVHEGSRVSLAVEAGLR